jgi:hypothetical protein
MFATARGGLIDMGKRFIFRNYWWRAIAGAAIAITIILLWKAPDRTGLIGAAVGAALAFCYFAQKQNLDELRLFRELFTDFNLRYDDMNEKLEEIHAGIQIGDTNLRTILVRYFNLCAEEYLFYREGFIHRSAWRSWCLGILYYLNDERIRKIWDDEVKQGSYYGLTFELIELGSSLPASLTR